MGSVNGSAGSDPLPVDINAFLREILGYEPSENDVDCFFPSLEDEEMGDNFSLFDNELAMADSEINLCRDLQSVNLYVPSSEWMCDNLINGDIRDYINLPISLPLDDVALETPNLQLNLLPDAHLAAKNTSFGSTAEDSEKQDFLELKASDAGNAESELKKKGMDLLVESETVKENKKLSVKDAAEEEALGIDDALKELKRKAFMTEFEPRKKSCKHKGISLRLSRLKTGNWQLKSW